MSENETKQATPRDVLEKRLMSYNEAKSELEWYAMHQITDLRTQLDAAREELCVSCEHGPDYGQCKKGNCLVSRKVVECTGHSAREKK
jgi:hypothetical protein